VVWGGGGGAFGTSYLLVTRDIRERFLRAICVYITARTKEIFARSRLLYLPRCRSIRTHSAGRCDCNSTLSLGGAIRDPSVNREPPTLGIAFVLRADVTAFCVDDDPLFLPRDPSWIQPPTANYGSRIHGALNRLVAWPGKYVATYKDQMPSSTKDGARIYLSRLSIQTYQHIHLLSPH